MEKRVKTCETSFEYELYETPEIEMVLFGAEDIITTSIIVTPMLPIW